MSAVDAFTFPAVALPRCAEIVHLAMLLSHVKRPGCAWQRKRA